ncbi:MULTISPECIES: MFS transporter [Alicyclobacillus]|uniref:MFS transporter n=1 Tax=Alicyclobacillus acidoterrestris (strain ATCC 49025 / DSM 3922 / CIP 106132 / NCIMB 13137 / GD3B) TaxID=1356854 RepID=A0A9E6ZFD3_ALIAG|nr:MULTISPECIES: MFS transporter [Alicyclobacillus]UNO48945.1 MFS transporter [Alicyclobacillus acidoterrestris]
MFKRSSDSVLNQPSYTNYWVSRILSNTCFQMLSVAIGWQMYALTHSAFSLGFVGLAQFLPMVVLTLVVGHVADRFDRRVITLLCLIVEAMIAACLFAETFVGALERFQILLFAAGLGACRAFEGPASSALLPQIVRQDLVQQAVAWTTSGGQAAQILGPSLGGVLYSLGPNYVYSTVTVALVVASILNGFIRVEKTIRVHKRVSMQSLFEGLVFVYRHKVILGTISLDLFAVLLGGATALLPIFAQDILHTGAWGLGLMRSAPAVGALLMSIVFAYYPLKKAVGMTLFGALAVFGLATMLFAVSTHLVVSLIALFLVGASDVVSVVIRSSLVQLQTPDEMRGRVNAVNSLFIGTSNQLGEFESGMVAGFIGAVPAALIGGFGTLVVAGIWMYLFPSIRRIRSLSEA